MKYLFSIIFSIVSLCAFAQANDYQVYPTHWFTNMQWNKVQLMIHGDAIANAGKGFSINYPGIKLTKTTKVENSNYVFLDITIAANTKPGIAKIKVNRENSSYEIPFEIKARRKGNGTTYAQGVTQKDFVYLLMPDRFCNADISNDSFEDMNDFARDRSNPFDRHGGDLQGVQSKLDYLKDLGVTTIWMTPVVENDMKRTLEGGTSRSTYHGYAFTNQYKIDRRFGGNEVYKNLVNESHKKGLKIIQDAVYNHIGEDHFLMKDLPAKDWLNNWPSYTNTSYKDQALPDVYASKADANVAVKGWFTPFLADLNQQNPLVSNFLIQYALWATEEFGIDGWRVDTYFYSDAKFLNDVNAALYKDFPKLTVFGEAWVNSVANSAYFCENNINVPFKHNAQGVTDFPFLFSTIAAFNENYGWNDGANKLYQTVAQDYLYKNPFRNCIFLGNHDLDRIYSVLGEDINKMKAAHVLLLTHRGIPQIYYGDEILVKNFKNPTDAEVRKDFVGGWPGDSQNKFTAKDRTEAENDFFNFLKTLANYRKNSDALTNGKLTHYIPNDGVYVYFRYTSKQKIMVVINTTKDTKTITLNRFTENLSGAKQLKDIFSNASKPLADITLEGYKANVFEVIN
jgi:glycosidase